MSTIAPILASMPPSGLERLAALLPQVLFLIDRELRVVYISPSSETLMGAHPRTLIGQTLRAAGFPPEACDDLEKAARRALEGTPTVAEFWIGDRAYQTRLFPERDAGGDVVSLAGVSEDITQAKSVADALRDRDSSLRALIEPWAYALWEANPQGTVLSTSPVWRDRGEQVAQEWVGSGWITAIHPDDREYAERQWREAIHARHPMNAELRVRRGDGGWCWTNVRASPVMEPDGRVLRWVGINIDITDRKRDEQRLQDSREQLRQLASKLQVIREEEKTRIARDLHDQLAQVLTVLKLSVRSVESAVADLPPTVSTNALLDRTVEASALAEEAIASVRRLALELRPGTLDRLGLGAALREEARRFTARSHIQCEAVVPGQVPEINPEVATAIYRICQEALTNVLRHANASRVAILLDVGSHSVTLKVEDDGKGLDQRRIENAPGLGLLGIVERNLST